MSRNVLCLLAALGSLLPAGLLAQQPRVFATRISTNPAGMRFFVDGEPYRSAQSFMWTEGSRHTLAIERDQFPFPGQRAKFTGWSDPSGTFASTAESVTVIAGPAITAYQASFTPEVLVRVVFYQCTTPVAADCRPPGTVYLNNAAYTTDVEQWVTPDTDILLQAVPNPGFVFNGWGPPSNHSMSFHYSYRVRGPVTFSNIFAQGKRVTLLSDPAELLVAPDRAPQRAPAEMDWAFGSRHILGVVSPQSPRDNSSKLFVFRQWSNGARENDVYVVGNTNVPETITAHYVPGARVSLLTNPSGLRLRVEGRENWPGYNFVWGQGMSYQITAPAEQTDARGRRFVFKGWSNGGTATQQFTVTADHVANGFRMTAEYEPQNRVTIRTNPPGITLMVNGEECRGSCSVFGAEGEQVRLSAPPTVPISETARLEFTGWTDSASLSRVITIGGTPDTTVVANYRSQYRLVAVAEPGNGIEFRVAPSSADGFYEADSNISITALTRPGFRFRRWEGDLSGSFHTGQVQMSVPRVVRAFADIAPFADEAGVRNAAAVTPERVVAPGSVASIYGANLAGAFEQGPLQPLAQTIGGVTVRLESRLLPLLFVSPEQINLLVPSDLPEGSYRVGVRWMQYPEVFTEMRVSRNAPGLFERQVEGRLQGMAARADGSAVSPANPARRGEAISLFGTGFGPLERMPPDGFPLPELPAFALADRVEVLIGNSILDVQWAGGASGQIGTQVARFTVPEQAALSDGGLWVQVRVNGRESNRVLLPVE